MVNPVETNNNNNSSNSSSASNPDKVLQNALYIKEPTIEEKKPMQMFINTTETLPETPVEINTEDEVTLETMLTKSPSYEYLNNQGNKGQLDLDELAFDANGKLIYDGEVTHAVTGKPTALYVIEGDPPPPPPAVMPGVSSKGHGDPHFVGFDGSKFDFQGIQGRVFNLLSDAKVQVNSLFQPYGDGSATTMGQIGVRIGGDNLLVNAHGGATLNGSNFNGTAKLKNGTVARSGSTTTISTKEYSIAIYDRGSYLDIGIQTTAQGVNRDEVMPGGVIGQTASGRRSLSISQFLVHDGIFGTNVASNKFGAKTKIDKLKDKVKEKFNLS